MKRRYANPHTTPETLRAFGLTNLPAKVPHERSDGRGLDLPDRLTATEVRQICAKLVDKRRLASFDFGDILLWVKAHDHSNESPIKYNALRSMFTALGFKDSTLNNPKSVAKNFPPDERYHNVQWAHYDEVRRKTFSQERRHALLARAERENWSLPELRNAIRVLLGEKGKPAYQAGIDRLERTLPEIRRLAAHCEDLKPILKEYIAALSELKSGARPAFIKERRPTRQSAP
jgi:hypothetical protein